MTEKDQDQQWVMRLYIVGMTQASRTAIANLKAVCDERLAGRYQLEVIDLNQQPALAVQEQIFAAPTLVRVQPEPPRKVIGDLSNQALLLRGLELPLDERNQPE